MKKMPREQRGFTLLESVIALLLMMVVGLAAASLFAYAAKYNNGATDRAAAIALAQDRIETLRSLPFDDASLAQTGANGVLEDPQPRVEGRPYDLRRTVVDVSPTMKLITITVTPITSNNNRWDNAPVTLMTRRTSTVTGVYRQ